MTLVIHVDSDRAATITDRLDEAVALIERGSATTLARISHSVIGEELC